MAFLSLSFGLDLRMRRAGGGKVDVLRVKFGGVEKRTLSTCLSLGFCLVQCVPLGTRCLKQPVHPRHSLSPFPALQHFILLHLSSPDILYIFLLILFIGRVVNDVVYCLSSCRMKAAEPFLLGASSASKTIFGIH